MIDFIATTPVITMAAVLVVVIGGFFLSKGIVKKHQLRGWAKHSGKIHPVGKGLAAGVSWTWMGEEFHATDPDLYSFTSGEEIGLLINPQLPGMFTLNVWTHNGKMDILIGLGAFLLGIGLAALGISLIP